MDKIALVELERTEVEIMETALGVFEDTIDAMCRAGDAASLRFVVAALRGRLQALSERLDE